MRDVFDRPASDACPAPVAPVLVASASAEPAVSTPRRRALGLAAGSALWASLGVLSGCGDPDPPLKVGTIVFPGYEFLFLARESGQLKPEEVRLVELLSSTDNLRLVEENRLDAATLTVDEVMATRAKGVDLRIVAVLDVSEGADAVMARAGIATPEQLRGRRVADGAWWVGRSTGSAFTSAPWATLPTTVTWLDAVVGDFNRDGRHDIATRHGTTGAWRVLVSSASAFTNTRFGAWSTGLPWSRAQGVRA